MMLALQRALATDILYQLYHALSFCVVADVNVVSKICMQQPVVL